jgi:two-component system sensor histidine kinase GlrK
VTPSVLYVLLAGAIGVAVYLAFRLVRIKAENKRLTTHLDDLERMKRDFISHVSHELKAPLASMQETTHLLLERIPGPLTDKQTRLLDLNLQSGKRLAQMLGNILDLARLEAGIVEYQMQTADIAEVLRGVIAEHNPSAQKKSLQVLTGIPREAVFVECDPKRMVQLFTNLLENAIRFSGRGGSVSVNLESSREHAVIAIADSGPGIEDTHKQKVFGMFHQVKQGKKSLGESLGTGLAISRAVVEAHVGKIWVEDNPHGGSVFYVALPRKAQERLAA